MKNYKSQADWKHDAPLTVLTYGERSVCIEHRSVEVCGVEIKPTAKEFYILALLILNPKRVFTYRAYLSGLSHLQLYHQERTGKDCS